MDLQQPASAHRCRWRSRSRWAGVNVCKGNRQTLPTMDVADRHGGFGSSDRHGDDRQPVADGGTPEADNSKLAGSITPLDRSKLPCRSKLADLGVAMRRWIVSVKSISALVPPSFGFRPTGTTGIVHHEERPRFAEQKEVSGVDAVETVVTRLPEW